MLEGGETFFPSRGSLLVGMQGTTFLPPRGTILVGMQFRVSELVVDALQAKVESVLLYS